MSEILIKKREPTTTFKLTQRIINKTLRQEDYLDLEASLSYRARLCLKRQKEAGDDGAL